MQKVPILVYENETKNKNTLIYVLLGIIFTMIITWLITVYLFVSFINQYHFVGYEQDGTGINSINSGTQGDLNYESKTTNDD